MRAAGLTLCCALAAMGCATGPAAVSADAGPEGGDGGTFEAGNTCVSALSCTVVNDCVRPGTLASCWQCLLKCCIPITPGNDPRHACDAGSACLRSTCDGAGSCSTPLPAVDGTACGTTCSGIFLSGESSCRNGACVGEAATQKPCADRCFGDYTGCPVCDGNGCVASCDPLPSHPDRCFP